MAAVADTFCLCALFIWVVSGASVAGSASCRKDAEMEITINGNVTINQSNEEKSAQGIREQAIKEDRQPIDRTNEVLIDNSTSFNGLIDILMGKAEVAEAAVFEAQEKEREEKEAKLHSFYGDDYESIIGDKDNEGEDTLKKARRRPGAVQLRLYEPMVARYEIKSGGLLEVFTNGYAVYDNGDRKTVVWVPDCGCVSYYFTPLRDHEKEYLKQHDEIGLDVLGACPWYQALTIAGEDSIEHNLEHPKSKGTSSDSDDPEEWESKGTYSWACGAHYDSPEDAYLRKEAAEERRKALTERQENVYVLYYEKEMTQEEIADSLGITQPAVNKLLDKCHRRIKEYEEKNL